MALVTSPVGRITILVLVALVLSVQLLAMVRVGNVKPPGFNSDNIAQQTILSEWQRGMKGDSQVGDDSWYLKAPLEEAMNQVKVSPELRVSVTAWILSAVTIVGSILVLWLLVAIEPTETLKKKFNLMMLSVASIASLSSFGLYVISRINDRNIEIPLFMLLLVALLAFDRGRLKRPLLIAVAAAALIGILISDDPMNQFIGALLVLAIYFLRLVWLKGVLKARSIRVLLVTAAGVAVALIIKALLPRILPIFYYPHPQSFATISRLMKNLRILFTTDLAIVNADFWGRPLLSVSTLVIFLNLVTLVLGLFIAGRLIKKSLTNRQEGSSMVVIGLLPFWIIFVVAVANFNANIAYLILLPFALAMCLVLAASRGLISQKFSTILIVLLFIAASSNTVSDAWQLHSTPVDHANTEQKAISQLLHENHLTKGVATYWRAAINSYFSGYYADIANVDCSNVKMTIKFDPLLSDQGILKAPASNFFVLYYPTDVGGYNECNYQTIAHALGTPDRVLTIPTVSGGKIAVYDHDVSSKIIQGK